MRNSERAAKFLSLEENEHLSKVCTSLDDYFDGDWWWGPQDDWRGDAAPHSFVFFDRTCSSRMEKLWDWVFEFEPETAAYHMWLQSPSHRQFDEYCKSIAKHLEETFDDSFGYVFDSLGKLMFVHDDYDWSYEISVVKALEMPRSIRLIQTVTKSFQDYLDDQEVVPEPEPEPETAPALTPNEVCWALDSLTPWRSWTFLKGVDRVVFLSRREVAAEPDIKVPVSGDVWRSCVAAGKTAKEMAIQVLKEAKILATKSEPRQPGCRGSEPPCQGAPDLIDKLARVYRAGNRFMREAYEPVAPGITRPVSCIGHVPAVRVESTPVVHWNPYDTEDLL